MSAESELERSALERKDREELLTIATALGGKPGSRAKKADIVDLILELTGVTPAGGATAAAESADGDDVATESTAPAEPTADDAGAESTESRPRTRRPRRSRAAAADAASADADADSATTADAPVAEDTGTDDSDATDATDTADSGARADDESAASADEPSDDDAGATAEQGGPATDTSPAEVEQPSRRRRRRGRDRDRSGGAAERPERGEETFNGEPMEVEGMLDLRDEGYGFIRVRGYLPSKDDVYVSVKQARQFSLRRGDLVKGTSRPASRSEKNPALLRIDTVNGVGPDAARERRRFDDLTPLFPDERLRLENPNTPYEMTSRIVDLVCPIGKGQRGMIVSPPKAGKTTVMKHIAKAIEANHPEVHLMVLLVDERPEEVTDMKRTVKGEVIASTFDRPAEEHTAVAELVIDRAKRLVEGGADVVVILDGITRLARAYNLAAPGTGRIMSGGIDTAALYPPKRFFGAARNLEEGGSLTILATALVETGSKMDEVIFEEFKGTGNMELKLDRRLAERRIYPAIDVDASSTRHEELLFERSQLQKVWMLRRVLSGLASEGSAGAGVEMLVDRLGTFKTNAAFLDELGKA
jgi:transcription termination factor Rho